MSDQFIERKIVISLITSTTFIQRIRNDYSNRLIGSAMAKRIGAWCIEYYDKFKKAPGKDIEGIYFEKLKRGLPKDIAEEIEQEILPDLNEEFVSTDEDLEATITQAKEYFAEKNLELHLERVKEELNQGNLEAATALAVNFKPVIQEADESVKFDSQNALKEVSRAFKEAGTPLIHYPKALGEFWNHQLIRGALVALMAPEKRGKTYMLMDMSVRGVKQGRNVAFFQAGDMTKSQAIRRYCIMLAKMSDMERYSGKMLEPVVDCMYNQLNECDKRERECTFGVMDKYTEKDIRTAPSYQELKEAFEANRDYKPCHNCSEYKNHHWGVPWLREIDVKGPLELTAAKKVFYQHFIKSKRKLVLSSHANGTLTISKIKALLKEWEINDEFIPDIIIIDYADLLVPETKTEFRHQQNEIWKGLRNLSQEERGGKQPLVITATQADAASYEQNLIRMKNFSEDKRKLSHVMALWGLNQDTKGREKDIGILRINNVVIREGESSTDDIVYVLQNLRRGLPYISSYL